MKSLQIAFSIALFTSFGIQTAISKENSATTEYYDQSQKAIQQSFFIAVSLIQQIDQIVGDLAILISKHQIKGIASPDHIIRVLQDDRQLLQSFLQAVYAVEKEEDKLQFTVALLQICNAFLPHLEKGINSNFKHMPAFDIATFAKRRTAIEDITVQSLEIMVRETYAKIEKLKDSASKAGLTWYNLLARSVDKHFVSRWNKYHGSTITKGLGGAALLSSYIVMRYGKTINNYYVQLAHEKLTEKFGVLLDRTGQGLWTEAGAVTSAGGQPELPNNTTLFSLFDAAWNDISSGHAPLAMLAGGALWGFYSDTWKMNISPWFKEKRTIAWNFLRGGSYLNVETPGLSSFVPTVNFDHMVGLEEVKEAFKSILEYIDNPEKFLRSGMQPETGWILTGPTRTGKSFSFECLCGEIERMQKRKGIKSEFNYWKVGIQDVIEMGIPKILAIAKYYAPMIIFVDEIDLFGLQRVGDNRLLHDFLTALQSTQTDDPSKVVIVMAATNSPETLDTALRQYGRFGKEIRFEYPGFKYRKQFITKELNSMALNPQNFDINTIVAKTDGKSYEDLKAILRSAMTHAWARGESLTQRLIEESINTEINKIIMHDRKELPENELHILASHFAGKSLAMTLLDTNEKLDTVTTKAVMTELHEVTAWHAFGQKDKKDVQQKIVHGKLITKMMHDTIELKTKTHIINEAKVLIAGFIAEEIILGSCGMQCHPEDSNKAYSILDQLVFKGIDPNQLSKKVREQLRDKTYALLMQCKQEVKELLEEYKDVLVALTEELMKRSIMSEKDVKEVIDRSKK